MAIALAIFYAAVQLGCVFLAKHLGEKIGNLKAQQDWLKALSYQLSLYDDRFALAKLNAEVGKITQSDMELPAEVLKSILRLAGDEEKIKEFAGHYKPSDKREGVKANDPGRSLNQT